MQNSISRVNRQGGKKALTEEKGRVDYNENRKLKGQELPWGLVVRALGPSPRGMGSVLAGELRPHMPCGVAKKEKTKIERTN